MQVLEQQSYHPHYTGSLFKGPWGALFYPFYYEQYIDDRERHAGDYLARLYDALPAEPVAGYAYCSGYSGPFWLLHHLYRYRFIDIDIDALADDFIYPAMEENEQYIAGGQFDFLHGGAGICHFLLSFADRKPVRLHLEKFVAGLMRISKMTDKGRSMPVFLLQEPPCETGADSFSLAHGVCSLLILLTRIYAAGIAQPACRQLVYESIDFIRQHKNKNAPGTMASLFPGTLDGKSTYSRLSWCYGDMNVALSLWYCGHCFKESSWTQEALDIMHYNIRRSTDEAAGVADACLCHGSSGIAAFYRKFWHESGDPAFYDCAAHWHQNTLAKIAFPENPAVHGIRGWEGSENEWEYCWDLLDGSAGAGLSLLSHIQPVQLHWDEFLLIS